MKQINRFSILLLAGLVFVFSCAKEQADSRKELASGNESEEVQAPAGKPVTISALLSDVVTKVSFDPSFDAVNDKKLESLSLCWESTDKLLVADHDNPGNAALFDLTGGEGTKKAVFSGTAPAGATSYDVSIVHGDVTYGSQTQADDGDASHLQLIASKQNISDLSTITFDELNSVLAITALMPEGVAGGIRYVDITAMEADGQTPANIFGTGNSLTIRLDDNTGDDDYLHLFAALPAGDTEIPAGTTLLMHFGAPETAHTVYTRFVTLGSGLTFTAGKLNTINVNASHSDKHAGLPTCDGTSADKAYLIGDKYQMKAMDGLMTAGSTTYFKMVDDVDMADVTDWEMLNNPSPYDRLIDFDGNNKTVSHLGGTMFYVFKGSMKNFTLDGSSVTSGSQKGVLAQYIQGTNNYLTNVDVCNVNTYEASSGNCGGMIGRINKGSNGNTTATFVDCDVTNVIVNSAGTAGGFIGSVEAKVVLDNCIRTGSTVSSTNSYVGGLIGKTTAEVTLTDCSVSKSVKTDTLSGVQYTAGLVGYFTEGSITNCHSDLNVTGTGHYAGGLVAYMADGSITHSYATGNVSSAGRYRIGGLIGWAVKGTVSQCYATGNVSGAQYMGGLIGTVSNADKETLTVSECCYTTGTISPTGNLNGGLIGSKEGAGALSIENCYVSGNVIGNGPQRFGGILANHYAGTSTLENCYFSGVLRTNACIGGIVGWVEADGLSVTRCMPFPSELHATQNVADTDRYCSGLVIGYANKIKSPKMIVDMCYRSPAIADNFQDYVGVREINVVENHAFIKDTPATIPQRHDLPYGYYHHGRRTNSTTLSALVQRSDIGGAWSSTIWDFSEDYPRLKWMLP